MTTTKEVYDYIKSTEWISSKDLAEKFGEGDFAIDHAKNCTIFHGMSRELGDIVMELNRTGRTTFYPCSIIFYLIDGGALNIPLAKNARAYKHPHWLPCTISTTETVIRSIERDRVLSAKSKKEIIGGIKARGGAKA